MDHDRDPAALARDLLDRLGLDAFLHASEQAEACREAADRPGLDFWKAVSRRLRQMAGAGLPGPNTNGGAQTAITAQARWRLMQRVEHFRHQARTCERKAAEASAPDRDELLQIARHWLELAAYAELLVELNYTEDD